MIFSIPVLIPIILCVVLAVRIVVHHTVHSELAFEVVVDHRSVTTESMKPALCEKIKGFLMTASKNQDIRQDDCPPIFAPDPDTSMFRCKGGAPAQLPEDYRKSWTSLLPLLCSYPVLYHIPQAMLNDEEYGM